MKGKSKGQGVKSKKLREYITAFFALRLKLLTLCSLPYALCPMLFAFCPLLFASSLYAQEKNTEKDKIIDLPSIKIEIVDTTQVSIPREKFRSFTKPDLSIYAPLSAKERPWYIPATSIPGKLKEVKAGVEKDSLFLVSAQTGFPLAFSYKMLLVRELGRSEVLLDAGRKTLKSKRTPTKQDDSNLDGIKGSLAYRVGRYNLKTNVQYNAKELKYEDATVGEVFTSDKSLSDLSADLYLLGRSWSSLNVSLSSLTTEGPLSPEHGSGLDLSAGFDVKTFWPIDNPVETGLSVEYFAGKNKVVKLEEFNKATLRLYLRDNYIRIWSLAMGAGAELMLDIHKSSEGEGKWDADPLFNPYLLFTSQIGIRTLLQFGVERYVLRQNLGELYLDRDCVKFNPDLNTERTWDLSAALHYRLSSKFSASIKAFDKEIRNLTVFEEIPDVVLLWEPRSLNSARILGFSLGWELSFMDGRAKHSFEYTHESHDRKISYRPKDKGNLTIMYFAPFGLEPSLAVEFYGKRYVETESKPDSEGKSDKESRLLSSYFLWKPRISRNFGKYASVFLTAEIYTGSDKYQQWKGYELPAYTVDFGLNLRF